MVTDFGIAQVSEATQLTEVGQVMGTAHFMSPEQAAGETIDGRSDLYSLGIVAHFALTGKLPFDGPTVQSILAKHLTQPPPSLSGESAAIPRALAQAIDRTLAKEPQTRWPSGEALAEALTVAQGQRRETPAPLRVWLQKGEAFRWLTPVWSFFVLVEMATDFSFGDVIAFIAPFALHLVYELVQTRRVFAAGFELSDLRAALRSNLEQKREELAFEYNEQSPPIIGRVVRYVTYAALATSIVSGTGVLLALNRLPWQTTAIVFGISSFVTLLGAFVGLFNPGRRVKKRDFLNEARLKLWESSWGERLAKIASFNLKRRTSSATAVDRPTEVAIGMAAADLFRALPKPLQKQLGDLPSLLEKLEDDARAMRKRVETLGEQLSKLGGPEGAGSSTLGTQAAIADRREQIAVELSAARDASSKRLASAVAALENIRLDLLRLQAGAGSVENLTSSIEAARRIGTTIDATLEGREDTERILRGESSPPEGHAAASTSR